MPESYNGFKMGSEGRRGGLPVTMPLNAIEELVDVGQSAAARRRLCRARTARAAAWRAGPLHRAAFWRKVSGLQLKAHEDRVPWPAMAVPARSIDLLEDHLPFEFIKIDHLPDPSLPNGIPNPLLPEKTQSGERGGGGQREPTSAIAWDGDFDRCLSPTTTKDASSRATTSSA